MTSLESALQGTFSKIESLGGPAVRQQPVFATGPSSRITDTVIGNTAHDIHKVRAPSVILEESLSQAGGVSGSVAAASSSSGSRRKFVIIMILLLLALTGVVVAIFFIRRRNKRRAEQLRKEKEEREAAAALVQAQDAAIQAARQQQTHATPPTPTPASKPTVNYEQEALKMESQIANTIESQEAEKKRKDEQQQKRLQEMKSRLDSGIANVSSAVAQSIAAQRAFQSHTSTQEHDSAKVLQDTGKPNISAAPQGDEAPLPSEDLLNTAVPSHPTGAVPVNETSNVD